MKESFFTKLVKFSYGINRPFDEFIRSVINEAGNKIAMGITTYLFVSTFVLMVLSNLYSPMIVINVLIFVNFLALLISSIYMTMVIKRYGLDDYEYDNEEERKKCLRSHFINRSFTLLITLVIIIYIDLALSDNINFEFIVFYVLAYIISYYLDYRRTFK
ncbi:DUF3278 domain-containing protein [Apilactobacillus kunkeei]|nr:DUF3278 domain-containing protein [Apilactobacillus kunkeei]KOY71719.1 hypothetical protein RZ79_02960 [Apilactobacillus kunkeei DSM 12361 = ATCC 700308]QYU52977.1 DUF3278 domain-containing protein [Apilactobacillus kunkeei]